MSAILKESESPQQQAVREFHEEVSAKRVAEQEREKLAAREHRTRECLQVLEALRACAEDGFEREWAEQGMELYRLRLNDIQWEKRYPGPKPATDGNEPDYWREKQQELRAEGEGFDRHYVDEPI